jgi:hypothetical protein
MVDEECKKDNENGRNYFEVIPTSDFWKGKE